MHMNVIKETIVQLAETIFCDNNKIYDTSLVSKGMVPATNVLPPNRPLKRTCSAMPYFNTSSNTICGQTTKLD